MDKELFVTQEQHLSQILPRCRFGLVTQLGTNQGTVLYLRKRCDLDLDLSVNSQVAFTIIYKWDGVNKIQSKEQPSRTPEERHSTFWLLSKALETNSMQMYVIRKSQALLPLIPKATNAT